ncbi:carotenoid isomerooxygenase isoform X2 [Prorops nasuta]|uniref:carotenoid isomerooxygenase isoform X2 n=1 Tax=Prorops nasuta TaxID=863751 RepID=UPI0034CE51C6
MRKMKDRYRQWKTIRRNYWPNCDASIWIRSCKEEVIVPLKGKVTGTIPHWLQGTLFRNGPGNLNVGNYTFKHLFDSSALLHRFHISGGNVTYQNRFVQTDVYKRNKAAQRIVVSEFGTAAIPDPCKTIFQRITAIFKMKENMSDNSNITIYPFGDEFYTFTETPVIHRIDPVSLETKNKVNVSKFVNIVNHTSHPHIMSDGTVYNLGMSLTLHGPTYNIIRFAPNPKVKTQNNEEKKESSMFQQARIMASVSARWPLNPSYMHTFGITENYFIIVEQPLSISLVKTITGCINEQPMFSSFNWNEKENTLIHVVSRKTGKLERRFNAEAFFFLHIINQFETACGDYVMLDICCYRDAQMLNCMYIDALKNVHNNSNYAELFRGRPLRFVLPLLECNSNTSSLVNLIDMVALENNLQRTKKFKRMDSDESYVKSKGSERNNKEYALNLHSLIGKAKTKQNKINNLNVKPEAYKISDRKFFVKPELLCNLGCETPTVNLAGCQGKPYRYFYAISSDVDLDNPGTIIKVDTVYKIYKTWSERNVYPSEPIFVPRPNSKSEDDGLILCALIWGKDNETEVGLLILDAMTFTEIARATFRTPGPVPKCLHGWFHSEI